MDQYEYKKRGKIKKKIIVVLVMLLCFAAGGVGGYFVSKNTQISPSLSKSEQLEYIRELMNEYFVDTTDSEESLDERMLYGMLLGLGDPHTTYLTPEQAQEYATSINGAFEGIGLSFRAIDEGALVLETYRGTPSYEAGILSGDVITHVQGTSVAGYDSDKIKNSIQGDKGSEVKVKVLRDGKSQEFTMKRENVETSLGYEIKKEGNKTIGYVRMTTFGDNTASLLEDALKNFKENNVDTICLDLRGNGGGYLDAAIKVLDLFVPKNKVVLTVKEKDDEKKYETTSRDKYEFSKGYILMDEGSASASEVTAGALSELMDYKIVGQQSYGKGTVQSQQTLSDSSVVKYTSAKWYTPKGENINGEGLTPDYPTKVTDLDITLFEKIEKTYQYDQVSTDIETMQKRLKLLGYKIDRTDGYFSKETEKVLKEFQKNYGLKETGKYSDNDNLILYSAATHHLYQKTKDVELDKIWSLMK